MKPRSALVALALMTAAGCSSAAAPAKTSSEPTPSSSPAVATTTPPSVPPTPASTSTTSRPVPTNPAVESHTAPRTKSSSAAPKPQSGAPVIVIDPGHSVTVQATDPATGLNVSDYANEPEMRDVFAVAQIVRTKLVAAGYRVILTKATVDTPTSLAKRSQIANDAHAALALSIHDQAGGSGGIGFRAGNNTVYYQSVGDYRATAGGKRVYFTRSDVAALSKKYGEIFQRKRAAAQDTSVSLLSNTGYDLGSRGLPAGNIWIVQLLSHVPWIYNEAGGNSAGMVGLSYADKTRYAAGLVAAVETCVPIRK